MTINERMESASKKLQGFITERANEVYADVTNISKLSYDTEVRKEFAVKKKESIKEGNTGEQFDDERVIEQEVSIRYNKAIGEYMKENNLSINFTEELRDGKEYAIYSVNKIVKEYAIEINFDYTLKLKGMNKKDIV